MLSEKKKKEKEKEKEKNYPQKMVARNSFA
jgi:hypothetical protein